MKKTIGTVGVIVLSILSLSANAQQTWEARNNPTVDSINAKYKDKWVTAPAAQSNEQIFPVIGQYESATNPDTRSVSISLDAQNMGLIWIEGLPQGKIRALLTQSPATYKIPAQKNEEGKEVAEGTLIYDKEMNTLSICIGKPYQAGNTAAVFVESVTPETPAPTAKSSKMKKNTAPRPWVYTGSKLEKSTAVN